jgi:hypothetical protein
MIFIDGVGIGDNDPSKNPFVKYGFRTFEEVFGAIPVVNNPVLINDPFYLFPVDPVMGVDGLPQSGTGQVSIFCGVNAPKIVGKHFGPFPYSTTIPIIEEENILKYYKQKNKKVFFVNAYPKIFFDYLKSGRQRLSVTSLCCRLTGIPLNKPSDVRNGKALTAEITNSRWNKKLRYNLKIISPKTAARRLLRIAYNNDFTLYEFFLTDHLGHGRISDEFDEIFNNLDEFLFTILSEMHTEHLTIIICSDHGNIEDLSVKTHTMNPALTISAGKYAKSLFKSVRQLSDIKPAIIKYCK